MTTRLSRRGKILLVFGGLLPMTAVLSPAQAQNTPVSVTEQPRPVSPPAPVQVLNPEPEPPIQPTRPAPSPTEALRRAIEEGQTETVTALLQADPSLVKSQSDYGDLPFFTAVESGRTDMAALLLSKGADINAADRNGRTPISLVLQGYGGRSAEMLALLIDKGASLKTFDNDGLTPLHLAARQGSVALVKTLLDKGVDVNIRSRHGDTPLHIAAAAHSREVIELLLDRGALLTLRNKVGDMPLHAAMHSDVDDGSPGSDANRAAMEELLIERGAPVNAHDSLGLSPLLYSLLHRDKLAHGLLIQYKAVMDRQTAVYEAAAQDDVPTLTRLLKADPLLAVARVTTGAAPLHVAALWGAPDTALALLRTGADVNARDARAQSALHYAARIKGNTALVALLLAHDANVNAADSLGMTPLHLAVSSHATDVVKTLIAAKADVNALTNYNETPLTLIAGHYSGNSPDSGSGADVAALLLDAGADPNVTSQYNSESLLSRAIESQNTELVTLLLSKGADINAADANSGYTPLMRAVMNGSKDMVTLLLDKGADVSVKNHSGETVLSIAARYGNSDIGDLIRRHVAAAAPAK